MLVLTRKIGEEIRIDDDITVKGTSVQGGRVKLGIDAPRHRRISRPETEAVTAFAGVEDGNRSLVGV